MLKTILAASAAFLALPSIAGAQAVIDNGTIQLGVRSLGDLNTAGVGMKDLRTGFEATYPGCTCEGWGVAVAGTGITGYANSAIGTSGLNLVSFASTASTATSTVALSAAPLQVTHAYTPSKVADLYRVDVTITNTGTAATSGDVLYRRVMDWDIEPTAFYEYSTIQGTTGAKNILYTSDNGFASSDPFGDRGALVAGAEGDFVDAGPYDHGALFDFSFSPLGAGASQSFSIYFGASKDESSALAALGAVGAEMYSFGQSGLDKDGGMAGYATFIMGFKGVGGTSMAGAVPEPATWAMMILGMGGIGGGLRRRRAVATLATA